MNRHPDDPILRPIEAKAFYCLGRLKVEDVEPLMMAWQQHGLDGDAILELGWEPCTSLADAASALDQAFAEAGAAFDLSSREAAWIYMRRKLQDVCACPKRAQDVLYELNDFADHGGVGLFSEEDHDAVQAEPIFYDGGFGEELALRELLALRGNGYQIQLDMSGVEREAEVERIAAKVLGQYYMIQGYLPTDLKGLPEKYKSAALAWVNAGQQ